MHRRRLLPMRCSETIGPGVAAANDNNALAGGQNLIRNQILGAALVLLRQKVHREMDALQFPAWDRKIARMLGAAGEQNRIVILTQLFTWYSVADVDVGSKLDALAIICLMRRSTTPLFSL